MSAAGGLVKRDTCGRHLVQRYCSLRPSLAVVLFGDLDESVRRQHQCRLRAKRGAPSYRRVDAAVGDRGEAVEPGTARGWLANTADTVTASTILRITQDVFCRRLNIKAERER